MAELVKLGVEVHVVLPPGGPLIPQYRAVGVVVHVFDLDFPITQPWRIPQVLNGFRRLVTGITPEILHSHFVGTTLSMRLALGKNHPIPRVFQVPGPLHLEHAFFRQSELLTAGSKDYWIGSCRWTCERYQKSGVPQDHIFLSYYGIDLQTFSAQKHPGKLRRELGVAAETQLVGMVAYMYAPKRYLGQTRGLKGHEDFIDALAICRQHLPKIKGVFIGGAWNNAITYEQRVRTYAQKKLDNSAIFLGTRNDVAELYPDLNVVVHPSLSENVGGAGESLLMAIPTIATNVGGLPDMVIPGKTGWLVPPRNPSRLAEAILQVLNDPVNAQKLAKAGQRWVSQLMDVKTNAREIFEIYQKIFQRV